MPNRKSISPLFMLLHQRPVAVGVLVVLLVLGAVDFSAVESPGSLFFAQVAWADDHAATADHHPTEGAVGGDDTTDSGAHGSDPDHGDHAHQPHGADGSHEAHGAHDEHEGHEEHPELPNLIHLIWKSQFAKGDVPWWLDLLNRFQDIFYALLVTLIIITIVRAGTKRMTEIPGPLQNVVEMFIEGFSGFIEGILGREDGRRYVPFLGSLFLYIWFMNLFGLVPLMRSPTAGLSTTAALAVSVFLYVQYIAFSRLGFWKYMKHLAGDPEDLVGWLLTPLMFPLHVISEFAKPVSLSLRLFGNIFGEDILIGVFAGLGVAILAFTKIPIGVPLHLPFILLALLMSTIQALVFTLLSSIYIMQVLPHDHEEGDEA